MKKKCCLANSSPRGDVKNELGSSKSSPAQGQQGTKSEKTGRSSVVTDIPNNQVKNA